MKNKNVRLVIIALALVLVGSLIAGLVNTSFGNVKVTEVTYISEDGPVSIHCFMCLPAQPLITLPLPLLQPLVITTPRKCRPSMPWNFPDADT